MNSLQIKTELLLQSVMHRTGHCYPIRVYPISSSNLPAKAAFPAFRVTWKLMVNPVSTNSIYSQHLCTCINLCENSKSHNADITDKNWDFVLTQLEIALIKQYRNIFAFRFIKLMLQKCNTAHHTPVLWHSKSSLCAWRPLHNIR